MKITSFGRPEHQFVSNRVLAALKELEKELGLTFATNGGEIGQFNGMIRLKVQVNETKTGVDGAKAAFEQNARYLRVDLDLFEKRFVYKRDLYKITGIQLSRPTFPFDCVRVSDGKQFKFSKDIIEKNFPKVAA